MKRFGGQLKQAGISLLEVLLSLAIISIILVMAMQYFTTAGNNQKLNMVRTFIGADMAAIQGYGCQMVI
jgi:prepilin-type N-terminal cleavage/methylation domain-containing protein